VKDNFDYLFGQTTPGGLLNGSFEYDTDADGIPDNWTRFLYSGGSSGFETTNPRHGSKSFYFTHPGGAGNGGGYIDCDYIAVSPEQYTAQFCIRSTATGIKNIVQVLYYDKSKAYLGADDLYLATAADTADHTYTANYTPPSTCRFVKYRLIGGYNDTAVAGTTYFDGVHHFHVPDAAITESKLGAAAVTVAKLKMTQGSYSGSLAGSISVVMNRYGHTPVVGGSNVDVFWNMGGSVYSGAFAAQGAFSGEGTGFAHLTWDYHAA
jgi:hypothetical protein